jgi:hypothetical protein
MELRSVQALQYVMCFRKRLNHRWRTNMTVAFSYYVQKYKKFDLIII